MLADLGQHVADCCDDVLGGPRAHEATTPVPVRARALAAAAVDSRAWSRALTSASRLVGTTTTRTSSRTPNPRCRR